MIMAPNLFLVQTQASKQTMQMEVNMAAGTSNTMRMLIRHQELLWQVGQDRSKITFNMATRSDRMMVLKHQQELLWQVGQGQVKGP